MKTLTLVGTSVNFSHNRTLFKYTREYFRQMADIEIVEVSQLPPFNVDAPLPEQTEVWKLKQKVRVADGVIFLTPEHDHGIPAALKNTVEWLSYKTDVLKRKSVMVVGAFYGRQASARSQVQMWQILVSLDCDANLLPGNEALIGNASHSFPKDGRLVNAEARDNLENCFTHFVEYVQIFENANKEGLDMFVKQPTIGEVYISFPIGRLTLKEVQQIFSTTPSEIDLIDSIDHFAWFSDEPNREYVRNVASLGGTVQECHPPLAVPAVMKTINSFRSDEEDVVTRPLWMNGHRSLIQHYALRDVNGHYLGTIEFTGSAEYTLNLFENGAWSIDGNTGASKHENANDNSEEADSIDASTGASESSDDDNTDSVSEMAATPVPAASDDTNADAITDVSDAGSVDTNDDEADATTGVSEN